MNEGLKVRTRTTHGTSRNLCCRCDSVCRDKGSDREKADEEKGDYDVAQSATMMQEVMLKHRSSASVIVVMSHRDISPLIEKYEIGT